MDRANSVKSGETLPWSRKGDNRTLVLPVSLIEEMQMSTMQNAALRSSAQSSLEDCCWEACCAYVG